MMKNVEDLLQTHLPMILGTAAVAVPDDEEEMNWRLFFAHSQDMQGFRADIFTGGPNEGKNPYDPAFVGLRERWGSDSRSLIAELARLWEDGQTKAALTRMSNPLRPLHERQQGVRSAIQLLHDGGIAGARVFAKTLEALSGPRIARKTNGMIRAYIQNSQLLKQYNYSFRAYLQSIVPDQPFPPRDVSQAEGKWLGAIQRDFYGVGPALANYMVCDWLLWLWREGRIDGFESYKPDSVHLKAVEEGLIEMDPTQSFVAYCKTLRIPAGYGSLSGRPCPPRVLNECIWLEFNHSSGPSLPTDEAVVALTACDRGQLVPAARAPVAR